MKTNRLFAVLTLIAFLLAMVPAPAVAQGVSGLERRLDAGAIDGENKLAPSCAGGSCGSGGSGGGCSPGAALFGGGSGGGGFFQNLFGGILDFIKNLFGGIFGGGGDLFGGGGGSGGGGGCPGGDCGGGGGSTGGGDLGGGGTSSGGDTGSTGTATTPDAGPVPETGEVPSGRAALKAAIKQKFNVTMADGQRAWTEAQLRSVYKTLSVLPENFRKWNRYMERGGNRGGMAGLGQIGGQGKIWLFDSAFRSGDNGIGVIVHEITHNFQGNNAVNNLWRSQIRGRSVSSYGNTNWKEDMAESVRAYYMKPAQMKATHASRYNFIKQHIMGGREFTGNEWR